MAQFLEENFPELRGHVEGGNYPPPPLVEMLSNILSVIQLGGLAWIVMGGEALLGMVGYRNQMPGFYFTIQKYSVQFGIFLFLVLPQVLGKWRVTGAFELYLDGEEEAIYSKIATGAFPKGDDLVSLMAKMGLKQASTS